MIGLPMLCRTRSKAEPDPQAELEFHVDARHLSDDVRVGIAHAVHVATGSAKALGAPLMLMTPTALAATKSRPVRDRVTDVVIRTARFS